MMIPAMGTHVVPACVADASMSCIASDAANAVTYGPRDGDAWTGLLVRDDAGGWIAGKESCTRGDTVEVTFTGAF